uniref:SsrA-binding protein n=1 Tax=Globisporangium ultimum (strain ATCC 200006 / CBS 805.95 / DAOM BR144) TaxID=431595 RepID=K3X979_GLOUD
MGSTPWQLTATRTIRNYRVNVLMRNQNFLRKIKSFEVEKEWNVGIVLEPSEVKSLRERNGDLSAAFAEFYRHELFIHQLHIPVWRHGLIGRPEPMRVRKLLANRSELKKMEAFMSHPNAQLIPMRIEIGQTGWLKVVLAQCYKQKSVDNRKRDDEREVKRQLRDW